MCFQDVLSNEKYETYIINLLLLSNIIPADKS